MGKLAKVTDVGQCMSIDDMLNQSGTNWDVEVLKADVDTASGPVANGGFRALVRPDTNTALAFVGERYRANNHRSQLMSLDGMVRNGDIIPVSVSIWDNGAMLAYQFRCPDLDVTILDKDVVSPLLTLAFAYGSQLADSAFFSDFRWFCKNQMGHVAPLMAGNRVKHRGNVHTRFAEVLEGRIQELGGELSDRYKLMRGMTSPTRMLQGKPLVDYFAESIGASKEDADKAWVSLPDELSGKAAELPAVLECWQNDDCGAPGTVWQAFNAVTRYETHKHGKTAESRHRRMLLGSGSAVAENAWRVAAGMAV